MSLSFPICLYREAIRLQCFPPTRYVKNGEYLYCTRMYVCDELDLFAQNSTGGSMLVWLYHACSYTVGTTWGYPDFFLLSVSLTCYTEKNLEHMEALQAIFFLYGHAEWVVTRILDFFIHAFKLKVNSLEHFPIHICTRSHTYCYAHALSKNRGIPIEHAHMLRWRPLPDLLKIP